MRPEYCEPLNLYDVLTNDDDEILIVMPGYFKGEPENPRILYDGKENAVFIRNGEERVLLLDMINEGVRPLLYKAEKVLFKEIDSKYEYFATVEKSDIEFFSLEASVMHPYYFSYFPFPQTNGVFKPISGRCDVCKKKITVGYNGAINPGSEAINLCPNCISEGKAARRKKGFFTSEDNLAVSYSVGHEIVMSKTPPIFSNAKKKPLWLSHCDKMCVYLGMADVEDLGDDIWDEIVENWDYSGKSSDIVNNREMFEGVKAGTFEGHYFRCPVCQHHLMYFAEK